MAKAAKKTSARAKPKSARNATSKQAKRVTTKARQSATQTAKRNVEATANTARSAANTATRRSQDAMSMGTTAMRDFFNNSFSNNGLDSQAAQNYMSNFGQEGAAQLAKSADAATRSFSEMFSMSKENMDTCVECSNTVVSASKTMGAELFSYANNSFSQNVELSKELLACRTLNDMFDLQSKMMKTNLDGFFSESVKVSEMMFRCATEVSEPINERISETAERISRSMYEAA